MLSRHGAITLAWLGINLLRVNAAIDNVLDLQSLLQSVKWSARTAISYPATANFTQATERWTYLDSPTYLAAVSPATEADIKQLLQLATSNNIPFLVSGGRHGFTSTLGQLQAGLAIDLSRMNDVTVNKSAGTMTVGGGTRLRDIYDPVYEAGYELPIGTCSCPGIVGVTLGAGIGPWAGVHGFIIDTLLAMVVLTANGTVVHAAKHSHSDLFWALRGAGANFGVVLSATYQLQPQINNGKLLVAELVIPAEKAATYFDLLKSYESTQPPALSLSSFINFNSTTNQTQVAANWAYIGPEDEGLEAFQPVLSLDPIVRNIQTYQWNNVIRTVSGGIDDFLCTDNLTRITNGANARVISPSTYMDVFQKTATFFANYPAARYSEIELVMYPTQAAAAVPDNDTAYPWRDARMSAQMFLEDSEVGNSSLLQAVKDFAKEVRSDIAETSGYPDLAVYVNNAAGDETEEQIYRADKLPRLLALKKAWDPDNIFRFYNPLM
ncbi:FAD-binding domain-containing protein [Xylariaceae sp. FL0594]|nr:FAD-binding domain-containing protein [Xylariaceae sp. FL0594]